MTPIEQLIVANDRMQLAVDAAIAKLSTPSTSDGQIVEQATRLDAQAARLELATNPPIPIQ